MMFGVSDLAGPAAVVQRVSIGSMVFAIDLPPRVECPTCKPIRSCSQSDFRHTTGAGPRQDEGRHHNSFYPQHIYSIHKRMNGGAGIPPSVTSDRY